MTLSKTLSGLPSQRSLNQTVLASRCGHSCGLFTDTDGLNPRIFIAGGTSDWRYREFPTSTAIFNWNTRSWQLGPHGLPGAPWRFAAVLSSGRSFLIMGGIQGIGEQNTIRFFDPDTLRLEELGETLHDKLKSHCAVNGRKC